jgi:hypothetical protein
MPRNGSGTYTLPAGNPVTSGALIEASWANTTMSDLASAITDSLARNGEGGMTAPLRFADGSVGAPGFSWTNETATGIYRSGSGDMRVSLQGVDVSIWNSNGLTIPAAKALSAQGNATVNGTLGIGTSSPDSKLDVRGASGVRLQVFETSTGNENRLRITQTAGITDYNSTYSVLSTNAQTWSIGNVERMRLRSDGILEVPAGMTTATQTSGTNNTTVATTAFVSTAVNAAIQALHPVGSIYINATNSDNPATLLGFGTWVAFGAGRVPVGFDAGNALFNAAEKTGGSYDSINVTHTHTTTVGNQSAGHTHTFSGTTGTDGSHNHDSSQGVEFAYWGRSGNGSGAAGPSGLRYDGLALTGTVAAHSHTYSGTTSGVSADHTHTVTVASAGSSGTNANVQPYITVYMWKRTA